MSANVRTLIRLGDDASTLAESIGAHADNGTLDVHTLGFYVQRLAELASEVAQAAAGAGDPT
jgi:hypothetical protein